MTHTYTITGMTCSGCTAKVKSELLKLGGISAVEVQLGAPQAAITMSRHVATAALQQAIGSKYTITEAAAAAMPQAADNADTNSYYPIFLIFGYILGITVLLQLAKGSFNIMQWMASFMAGFYLLFSFFKLLNLKGFAAGYGGYDIIARRIPAYGYIYPFIELALGIAYLISFQPLVTNIVTLCVMGVSAIGVVQSLLKRSDFQCACLGTIIKLPLSKVTLFEDLLMVAMSGYMIIRWLS